MPRAAQPTNRTINDAAVPVLCLLARISGHPNGLGRGLNPHQISGRLNAGLDRGLGALVHPGRAGLIDIQPYVPPRLHGVTVLVPVGALYPPVTMHLDYHASIRPRGEVVLTRSTSPEGLEAADPVLGEFLGFLAVDIASHPERLQAVDAGLVDRLQSLVGGIEIDLDAALSADDA